jgi:hypothetical protein
MRNVAPVFALIVAVACGSLAAAPNGKPKAALYFPAIVGDKSVFERKGKDAGREHDDEFTEVVTAVEAKDGGFIVSVKRDEGGGVQREFAVRVTEKGIFGRKADGSPFDRCRLKLPAKKGDTWEVVGETIKTVYVVAGDEEVEVPAGKYKTIRVDSTTELPTFTIMNSTSYAAGVGVVKMRHNSGGREVTHSLKSFTPGKK